MEQQLHPYLLDGETVLWSGRTSPFKLRELPFRSSLYLLWLVSAAAAAISLLFLLPPLLSGQRSLGNTLIILVILLSIPAILSLQPFSDKYKLETRVLYAITNLRAITMVDGQVLCAAAPTPVLVSAAVSAALCSSAPTPSGTPAAL